MPHRPQVVELPYQQDSVAYFAMLTTLPYPVWLDSCQPMSQHGRYDILAADPLSRITTVGDTSHIVSGDTRRHSHADPFVLLQELLPSHCPPAEFDGEALPFCGGALGYFGYDLGRRLESIPAHAKADISLPDMHFGIYAWAIITDHLHQKTVLVAQPKIDIGPILALLTSPTNLKSFLEKTNKSFIIKRFRESSNKKHYFEKFDTIQKHILEGDCYQINFAQRFSSQYEGDPLAGYLALRAKLPSPFAGFMPLDEGAILCLSPERFIACRDGKATTSPIKGTIARGATPEQDQQNQATLSASTKDRAENLMIADLLRNDLSKTCREVKTPRLFELQSFANVHHLVSTITGRIRPDKNALDVLRAAFPGGSITGAPKVRAMSIIDELEPYRRGPYCGSLGYISACGSSDTNIAIRTVIGNAGQLHCYGGGGIVADSEAESEYQESITKVALLLRTLEESFNAKAANLPNGTGD
ncbi:aminodeoxychorismate synthase component I [Gilvimarinus agarilyticus]|uniref:aminodeoxychorismate synthase component I n=1 Tax=Gilvimarinus agarilyticus TaxID=679259 RepID=UPI00059EF418|nr:aminodeoxychorismate synthase component I [Gilvimarinus agarilyticus]